MKDAIISIIVPVYNKEPYIEKCVRSIMNQTYRHLEIILVDDGSTDGSLTLCRKLAAEDDRIIIITQENGGVSVARNAGIAAAGGDYIGFVDADDYVEREMYEKLINGYTNHRNIQLVSCGFYKSQTKCAIDAESEFDGTEAYKMMLTYVNHFKSYNVNKLYCAQIIRDNHIRFTQGLTSGEDARFNFDYFKYVSHVVCIPFALYHYLPNESSATNQALFIIDKAEFDLGTYFYNNSEDPVIRDCALKWSVIYYRSFFHECYKGNVSKALHQCIKKRIKRREKAYLKSNTLSHKEKLFIVFLCHFEFLYRIHRILKF